MKPRVVLDGTWQLLPVHQFRQGFYPFDSSAWVEQAVPSHWQQHPLFERYAGRMVYCKQFTLPDLAKTPNDAPLARQERWWLRLEGIFYWSQTYLNAVDLGRHEGYFTTQEYEVTQWLQSENTLIVEVECPNEENKFNKRMITGVFSHWDGLDPATNPGGIWQPVELLGTGPIRISEVLLHTAQVSDQIAEIRFRAVFDALHDCDTRLRWQFAPDNFPGEVQIIEQSRALSAGRHEITGLLRLRDPQLWWTHDMGDPNCYTISLEVLLNDTVSDHYQTTFGIRQFEMRDWIPYLNGVRFFIRGNNYAPGDTRLATMTPTAYERDLTLARDCNLNLLRVHAHVEPPAFYEAANRAGILLWQDFPLQWIYDFPTLPEALRQARQMVRQLFNHPAIVIWCMHNESLHLADTQDERWFSHVRTLLSVLLTSWNRSVMDRRLKRAAQREDTTRPVVRSSGEFHIPFVHMGTDTHFYPGWYYPSLRMWERFIKLVPQNIRFVTEFGAQSFPNVESCLKFMDSDVRQIEWQKLKERHGLQPRIMARWINWQSAGSLEELVRITQEYQIQINRFFIDRLRFYKYRPTGGIVPFMFQDPNPAVQWSVVDYWRVPKRSYAALRMAFSPQYLFALLDRDRYPHNQPLDLPIYVVNDQHAAVPVQICARLLDPHQREVAHIDRNLTLPPDCMAFEIERLRLTPPMAGSYCLHLTLRHAGEDLVDHLYEVVVGD
jgi:beta-mannosidase